MNLKKSYTRILVFAAILICQQSFAQVSQATMQQIQELLKEKSSRSPIDRKIDSRLLQAVREKLGQQMVKGINLEPANVDADAAGMFKADISANITDAFLSKLTALGANIIYASPRYHTVRATINLKTVQTIAGYAEVKFIQPAIKSMLVDENRVPVNTNVSYADRVAKVRAQLTNYLNSVHPLAGKVTSEGDATHRADDVRSTYGYQGQGIKIGVLSDSYNAKGKASADVASGDLPGVGNPDGDVTPVTVVADYPSGGDEGRAMLQVIHDLAPKATLFFATADLGEASFADNIETLRNTYHCDIICDDVFYYDEPAFQDGIVAQAVDAVTASGALYFSSAGNSGSLAKGTSGVFEGDFNDAGSPVFTGSTKPGTIHNFGTVGSPIGGDIITAAGTSVYNLTWSDSYGSSTNDYDLFLVNSAGNVKLSSTNIQGTNNPNPYEQVVASVVAGSDRLVVFKTSGAAVRAFHLNTNRGMLSIATNGQTTGHASAINAFCMAATPASTAFESGYPTGPYPNPFNSSNKAEPFSSDGPRKMFYNPDGSAISPGKFTFASNGGTTLAKPDLTAADGTKTTFSRLSGLSPFFGTSCAAPHAGAIAALLLSANPSLSAAQVRSILTSTALDIESTGYDNVTGYGIIQAFQAAGAVSTTCNSTYDAGTHSTFATAVTIPLNTDITGTIGTATDTDFYKFTIATKGPGRISLTNLPADYDMYIYTAAHKLAVSSKKRGTTSEVLSGNLPKGTFYVEIVGFNHAFNSTSCYTLNVSQSAGASLIAGADDSKINLLSDDANLVLYPNPVSSVLNINIPEKNIGGRLKITDAFGKTLLTQSIVSSDAHINVGRFTNGTYLLTIINKDGSVIITSKFEKQ